MLPRKLSSKALTSVEISRIRSQPAGLANNKGIRGVYPERLVIISDLTLMSMKV